MPTWLRRSLFALAAAALIGAAVAAWLVASVDTEHLKRSAVDWVDQHYERELAIDGPVGLSLFPRLAISLREVRLSERQQPQKRFATLDEVALSLRLWPLLARREIVVDRIVARGLRLNLRRDAQGRSNIHDLLRTASADGDDAAQRAGQHPMTLDIGGIELSDLQLSVEDAPAGIAGVFEVQQLQLGRLAAGQRSALHFEGRARLETPPLDAALKIDTELGLGLDPAQPLTVTLDGTTLHAQGRGFGMHDLDASAELRSIEFGHGDGRAALAGLRLQLSGAHRALILKDSMLSLGRLRLDAAARTLEIDQLALQLLGRRDGTTLDARLAWPALEVRGDALKGSALDGKLVLGGDRQLTLKLASGAPSGSFERISLPGVRVAVEGQTGPRQFAGEATTQLVLAPRPFAAELDGLKLQLHVKGPALPPGTLQLDGNARLSADAGSGRFGGAINDQRFEAQFKTELDRSPPLVEATAHFGTLDLTRFAAPVADAPQAPAPPAERSIDLAPLGTLDARLDFSADRLVYPPFRIDAIELQATLADGVLEVKRLAGRAWGGRIDASGRAEAVTHQFGLRLAADGVDLGALLRDTTGRAPLTGRGRVSAELSSAGTTIEALRAGLGGKAAFALRDGAVHGIDLAQTLRGWRTAVAAAGTATEAGDMSRRTEFSQLGASFDIRDGVARNTDLDGQGPFMRVRGEGSFDLARQRVDYLAHATIVNTNLGQAGPELVMLNRVTVPVQLSGSLQRPDWSVQWAVVSATLAVHSVPNVVGGAVGGTAAVLKGVGGLFTPGAAGAPASAASAAPKKPDNAVEGALKGLFGR
ncbi:AsmA protein [Rivibacter subsaxonicus]|uniref:AsmA protein n=2 Tax=Rivibacter subsaxonicus TaxID=457575 RepID=A0A4V2FSQ9_9BURK|nr:AsmA protein [Rivibacter subsaxonicus]